jgi:hypothetical protein
MIEAKEAAIKARNYIVEMTGMQPENVMIEEVELSSDKKYWLITLGYYATIIDATFSIVPQKRKELKIFKINAQTGEVEYMRIRSLNEK